MVCVLDVNQEAAVNTAEKIKDEGGKAFAYVCDVTDQAKVKQRFDAISKQHRIHILVNNAGVSHIGSLEQHNRSRLRPCFSGER